MAVVLSDGFKNRMRPPYVLGDEITSFVSPVNRSSPCSGKILPLCVPSRRCVPPRRIVSFQPRRRRHRKEEAEFMPSLSGAVLNRFRYVGDVARGLRWRGTPRRENLELPRMAERGASFRMAGC